MNIIAGGRGTGRTTEIIKACEADPGSVIVCAHSVARLHITCMAQEMGADIPETCGADYGAMPEVVGWWASYYVDDGHGCQLNKPVLRFYVLHLSYTRR